MYLNRSVERVLSKAISQSKIVLITGSRQVGKTTVARHLFSGYEFISLDDDNELMLAGSDPNLFFKDRKFPIVIDEAQYAPSLFRKIKAIADSSEKKGQIILTGSQSSELLAVAAEFLSGRVTIVEMNCLSCRELSETDFCEAFIPNTDYFRERGKNIKNYERIWFNIFRGFYPELLDNNRDSEWFYRDYVRTYIERDIRKAVNIKDELKFRMFLTSLAARSGQILVYDDIARDVGVDSKTVANWISVVTESGLIRLIYTYQSNVLKRIIKSPKLYFMDTGLLCFLAGWNSETAAKNGAMSGEIFETFIVSEIIKSFYNAGKDTSKIYYYRDKEKREIDLIIEDGRTIYPIEIKKGATVKREWAKNFSALKNIKDMDVAPGIVISQVDKPTPVSETVYAYPIEWI